MNDQTALGFAEKVMALLDEGSFTSTYKYAVLLGLLDLTLENVGRHGMAPESFTTSQLADKVIELYWPHAVPFGSEGSGEVLRQNGGRQSAQAQIVRLIQYFRTQVVNQHATNSLVQLRQRARQEFSRLRTKVEWKLIQMPLPRLQSVGNRRDQFIYEIAWDTSVRRTDVQAYQNGRQSSFDNRIRLRPGVGAYLIQLNALLRPLLHRQWARMVARLNDLEEARLERFLFGTTRIPFDLIRLPLLQLQEGNCFYCQSRMHGPTHVDHFIPWSRYPEDGLANLVLAHDRCNKAKRDFLPATRHVVRWAVRLHSEALTALQHELQWDAAFDDMRGVARGTYLRLPAEAILWVSGGDFETPQVAELERALA